MTSISLNSIKVFPWKDKNSPEFDEKNHEIAKYAILKVRSKRDIFDMITTISRMGCVYMHIVNETILQKEDKKLGKTWFYVIEIHVSGAVLGADSYKYRIFTHHGELVSSAKVGCLFILCQGRGMALHIIPG